MANVTAAAKGADKKKSVQEEAECITAPFLMVDQFMGGETARALRGHFEAHFAEPEKHGPDTHQVWNYWHVPRLYTYLRTSPEKIFPIELVQQFHSRLTAWAQERLGLGHVSWPFLSLYVSGCMQHLHNDSTNGRFGYVYSLTPAARRTSGGDTMVLKEGDLFRGKLKTADAGSGLYDLIPPAFDRLVLFDDRMPHGVSRVEGTMEPLHGRVVLHGHVSESGARITGPLSIQQFQAAATPAITRAFNDAGPAAHLHHGPLVLRVTVAADGRVQGHRMLVDRVARSDGGDPSPLVQRLVEAVVSTAYPAVDKPSEVTLPLLVGGLLPWVGRR